MVLIHVCFFCLNDTAPTEIYTYDHTLSLHDALPICSRTPAPPLPPKKTIASAVIAPFLVKPNDRASTPARQLTSAGAQPRKAKALAKRAPSMCSFIPPALATSAIAPISSARHARPYSVARSEEHTSELQSLMRISY